MKSLLVVFSLLAWGSCGLLIPVRFRSTPTQGIDTARVFFKGVWGNFAITNAGYDQHTASAICLTAGFTGCRYIEMGGIIDWTHFFGVYSDELANQTLDAIASVLDGSDFPDLDCYVHIAVNRTGASVIEPPWAAYNSPFHGIDATTLALVNNTLSLTVVIASLPNTVTTLTLVAEGQPLEHELTTVLGGPAPKPSPFWNFSDENYSEWYMLRYASISVLWTVVSSSNASVGAPIVITQDSTYTNFRFTLSASSTNERYGSASVTNLLPFIVKMPRVATATLTFSTEYPFDDNTTDFWVTFTTGNTRQDVSNGTASVEFWTSVPLPYFLNSSTIKAVSPTGTAVSVQLISGTSCLGDPCVQQWVFSFADVCNLHVVMAVSFEIACVSPESCDISGQSTDTSVILDFVGGNECNPVVVIPTAMLALELHKGTVDTPPVTTIANGDQAVIKVKGASTGAALTNVQVDNIVYWSNAGGVTGPQVTLMADGVCSSPKCTSNSITSKSVGADGAEISFIANCGAGLLVLFEQGIDSVVQWTFQVGVVFTYEGQQKCSSLIASTKNNNNIGAYSFSVDTRADNDDEDKDDDIAGVSSIDVGPFTTALVAAAAFFF